ncbi:DUF3316 domain-containing protein [Vibrio sp. RC27]
MKAIKNTLIATTMVLLSSQVFASDSFQEVRVVKTSDMSSKEAAYELALDKLEVLKNDTAVELNKDLGNITAYSNSVKLNDGSYITISEKMDENGNILYTGQVNANVTYDR